MSAARALALVLAVLALLARAARAQADDGYERLETTVVDQGGDGLYLDGGRERAIEIGDRVEIHPATGPRVDGRIRAVSRGSARAELDVASSASIGIGTRAVVLVPRARLQERARAAAAARAAEAARSTAPPRASDAAQGSDGAPSNASPSAQEGDVRAPPEHPPWTHPSVEWKEGIPLLAPIEAVEPGDRPREWSGRWYAGGNWIEDREGEEREYVALRSGLDLELANPFGDGGRWQLDLDLHHRSADTGDDDDDTTRARIERFSYAWGGVRGEPRRWEIGRFLSSEFPELGVIDGVEVVQRLPSGSRVGASAGFLPEWDDAMASGEDAQGAVFYRWVNGPDEDLALGAAAQKTWHEGESDRDLLVLTGDWRPTQRAFVHTSAWVDVYGSEDEHHDSGPELTRLIANASWLVGERTGLGLILTHFRFPEVESDLDPLIEAELADERTTRVGLSAWRDLSTRVRLYARADRWEDEEDSGGGGELRLTARDLLWDDGDVSLSVFDTDGRFSSGIGARVAASKRFGRNALRLELETTDYELADAVDGEDSLVHDAARASWDTFFGPFDLSIWAEKRFGDEQDSTTLGFLLGRSF